MPKSPQVHLVPSPSLSPSFFQSTLELVLVSWETARQVGASGQCGKSMLLKEAAFSTLLLPVSPM